MNPLLIRIRCRSLLWCDIGGPSVAVVNIQKDMNICANSASKRARLTGSVVNFTRFLVVEKLLSRPFICRWIWIEWFHGGEGESRELEVEFLREKEL